MNRLRLDFLRNEAGEKEGLGDAGIETFRDDPYASCARESGQNSRDAAVKFPVRMTFDVLTVAATDLPFHGELRSAVQACLDEAEGDEDQEKEQEFFRQASELMGRPELNVLQISDYSTRGLKGPPDQPRTPFNALLKGSGVSNKGSDTSGGSFGIGKNASFAVSDLQTVLYSTVYDEGGSPAFAAQGKVRLVSHADANGGQRRSTGYWGETPNYKAITETSAVPQWMRRTDTGTSIFCVGFRTEEHWANHMAYSLISNFFVAIYSGHMNFELDSGRIQINQNTISRLFQDPAIRAAAERKGKLQDFELSGMLYRCMLSPDTISSDLAIPGLGVIKLRILVADDLPKRVGIVRNGMLITHGLEHFGDRLERFAGSRDFIALAEPDDDASRLMKKLENPKHDSFSAERLSDPAKRRQAEQAVKALIKALRERIREATAVVAEDEVMIDELTQYFAVRPPETDTPGKDTREDPERFVYQVPKPAKRPRQVRTPDLDSGSSGGRQSSGIGGERGSRSDGRGAGDASGGRGRGGNLPALPLREVRNLVPAGAKQSRVLWFTPEASGPATLQIEAPGINSPEPLKIISTSAGEVSDGTVLIDMVEGVRTRLELTLDLAYDGPLEAAALAIVPEADL